jgi:hypothetical protein
MDGRKNNKGLKGNKGGRPSKADELKLVERLTPLADLAYLALERGLKEGNALFVKMWFEYMYGKPNQKVDVNAKVEEIKIRFKDAE